MRNTLKSIDNMFHYLAFVSFVIVSILVSIQILARYIPGFSAPWTDELTRLFFLYTMMVSSPMAIRHNEYAAIDVISANLKGRSQHILQIITYIIVGIVSFIASQQALFFFKIGIRSVSTSLKINMGIFHFTVLGLFALTFIYCILGILNEVYEMKKEIN